MFARLYERDMNSFKFTGSKVALVGYKFFYWSLVSQTSMCGYWLNFFVFYSYFVLFIEVGKEVQRRLEFWQSRLDEIEERFKELSQKSTNGSFAKGKQKGEKRQKVTNTELSGLSDYAAEVVYEFFLKVINVMQWSSYFALELFKQAGRSYNFIIPKFLPIPPL